MERPQVPSRHHVHLLWDTKDFPIALSLDEVSHSLPIKQIFFLQGESRYVHVKYSADRHNWHSGNRLATRAYDAHYAIYSKVSGDNCYLLLVSHYFVKVRPEIVDIFIDEVTFEVIILKTTNGSLIFYGPLEYQLSVLRQAILLSGRPLISAKEFHQIIEQSINEKFFPVICKYR